MCECCIPSSRMRWYMDKSTSSWSDACWVDATLMEPFTLAVVWPFASEIIVRIAHTTNRSLFRSSLGIYAPSQNKLELPSCYRAEYGKNVGTHFRQTIFDLHSSPSSLLIAALQGINRSFRVAGFIRLQVTLSSAVGRNDLRFPGHFVGSVRLLFGSRS
jgi:hypothetical protein